MLKRRLKTIAQPNDLILNPVINLLIHQIIKPLITNKNKPNVITVKGIVKKINNGFNEKLKIVSTIATGIAVVNPLISAPGRRRAVIQMAKDMIINKMIYSIVCYFSFPDTIITNSPFSTSSLFSICFFNSSRLPL